MDFVCVTMKVVRGIWGLYETFWSKISDENTAANDHKALSLMTLVVPLSSIHLS